jgi:hypothetical protein
MRKTLAPTAGALVVAAALLSSGCIVRETSHTLCLEPDGWVTWTVIDRNIHAEADTPEQRLTEETTFMDSVAAQSHSAAVAFRALGGSQLVTQVVSYDWPFAVLTQARFENVAELWQQYFDGVGMAATSRLTSDGDRTTWTIVVDTAQENDPDDPEVADSLESLLENEPTITLFMRHGEFVAATGFEIEDDGRVAVLEDLDEKADGKSTLVLSLTWTGRESWKTPAVR